MMMPGRKFSNASGYRYGFNGQEKDKEINPEGNITTAEYWEYDSRIGRRWNVDPVFKEYESPYATFGNNPLWFMDPNGADTAKYLSNKQLVDAIKVSYDNLKSHIDNKTFSLVKNYTKELDAATMAYWEKNQNSMSFGAYVEFREQVIEYHKGLIEVAAAVNGTNLFYELGNKVIYNKKVNNFWTVTLTQKLINEKNGELGKVAGMGLQALAIALGAIDPVPISGGPRTPYKSNTQQRIVNAGPKSNILVPQKAIDVVKYAKANNGAAMNGYVGGRVFLNDGRGGGQILARTTTNGRAINYKEYDVNQFTKGVNRGTERVIIGSDGKSYYTNDHYKTFTQINQ